jgi:Domain of unknown function (DUF1707)
MLLSDSDREQFFERLNHHHATGALSIDELERRVEAIANAQTREQAAAVIADLPPLPGDPTPARARWRRGHGDAAKPRAEWRPTDERFRDPRTKQVMRVWEDASGARHYVPDDQA